MALSTIIGSFTLFLILGHLLPGATIAIGGFLLFYPSILKADLFDNSSALIITGVVLAASYVQGPVAILIERSVFNRIWDKIFSAFGDKLMVEEQRSKIIAEAEIYEVSHAYCDQSFGEFCLFFNTGIWFILMSLLKFILSVIHSPDNGTIIAWILLVIGGIAVLYLSPLFKMRHLDALSSLEIALQDKKRISKTTRRTVRRKKSG